MTVPIITMTLGRHSADVMSATAHLCPRCQQMAWWWRNQNGETVCVGCAEEAETARPREDQLSGPQDETQQAPV